MVQADMTVLRYLGPSDNPVTCVRSFVKQFPEYSGRRLRWDDGITWLVLELWHDHHAMDLDEPLDQLKKRLGLPGPT
jgi:hypothetical protein